MVMASYKSFYPFCQKEAASAPPTNTIASQGKGRMSSGIIVAIVVPISVAVLIFIVGICCSIKRIRNKYGSDPEGISTIDISNLDSLQYDFRIIEAATNYFSTDNKTCGCGSFGEVYKGMLPDGQEIAVKRLSKIGSCQQDIEEFKNEVEVLAKLQHKNLMRLMGFCVKKEEKIIVYECVQQMSWTHSLRGYISLEYQKQGKPSLKFDVQNFDILLLEIISGKRHVHVLEDDKTTLSCVWRLLIQVWDLWEEGKALEFMDPTIRESCNPNEVMRCLHIALLCVQIDPADRPSMSSIILMLENYSMTLPSTSDPTIRHQMSEGEECKLSISSMEDLYSDR